MKSKVILNISSDDETLWYEDTDFNAYKVAEELKDITFEFVEKNTEHELLSLTKTYDVNLCLSNDATIHNLNLEFRKQDKPTNVLSFASIDDDEFWDMLKTEERLELGNIILAYETLKKEAEIKNISVYAHYCHLLVHGFLHILGYDHITDEQADAMEALETDILAEYSIDNPYQEEQE